MDSSHTIRSRLRDAGVIGLPRGDKNQGRFRYIPPRGYNPANRLPKGPSGGFMDRFENEWVQGPPHGRSATEGDAGEWDVQLSEMGMTVWGRWAKVGTRYINVTRNGFLSH
jgi:Novel toxin 17